MDFRRIFQNAEVSGFDISPLTELLSFEQINEMLSLVEIREFKKGEILIQKGVVEDRFFLLRKGVVSAAIVDSAGKTFNRSLLTTYQVFMSSLVFRKKPARLTYTCLTDCEAYVGNFKDFQKLTLKHHEVSIFYNKILQEVFVHFDDKLIRYGASNATERYLQLIKEEPKIESLISQKEIAFALGITPVQLSRIKSALIKK